MKIRCIAIDDNKPALDILKTHASKLDYLEWVEDFTNPEKALANLDKLNPDLIFLDVQMPEMSGLDFLRAAKPRQMIIFVSDHKQYAFDSYELERDLKINVVDYLSKIITFDKFAAACNKAREIFLKNNPSEFAFFKDGTETHKVKWNDIIYFKSDKQYIDIFLKAEKGEQKINIRKSLDELEPELPAGKFIRVHNSYIISVQHLKKIISVDEVEMDNGKQITVSKTYQGAFQDFVKSRKL
ncbi:MAG TPA: LytTR family DNA-binding domain-containing protein [Chitinophagales bacterium]|nr:LytTR family DNA-binding domain-containing protein [Chitinophagales bacterium]